MSEEPDKDQAVPDMETGDEHTTPPMPATPAAPATWSMPEPVFQQTSGYLPQGYLKQIEDSGGAVPNGDVLDIPSIASNTPIAPLGQPSADPILEMDETPVAPATVSHEGHAATPQPAVIPEIPNAAPVPAVNIEPQPYLSEPSIVDLPAAAPVVPAAKSSGMRTVLIALALLGMLALLIVFLAFVYAYFIAGTWNSTTF